MCVSVSCIIYLQSLKVINWSLCWCTGLYWVFTILSRMCDFLTLVALVVKVFPSMFRRHQWTGFTVGCWWRVIIIFKRSLKWGVWNLLLYSDIYPFCHVRKENVKSKFASSTHFRKKKQTKANKTWNVNWQLCMHKQNDQAAAAALIHVKVIAVIFKGEPRTLMYSTGNIVLTTVY